MAKREPDSFVLKIALGNDAMKSLDDVADALEKVVTKLRKGVAGTTISDVNGNTVGMFSTD